MQFRQQVVIVTIQIKSGPDVYFYETQTNILNLTSLLQVFTSFIEYSIHSQLKLSFCNNVCKWSWKPGDNFSFIWQVNTTCFNDNRHL